MGAVWASCSTRAEEDIVRQGAHVVSMDGPGTFGQVRRAGALLGKWCKTEATGAGGRPPISCESKATIRLRSSRRVDRLPVCAFHPGGGKKAIRRHRVLGRRDMRMASTAASMCETRRY